MHKKEQFTAYTILAVLTASLGSFLFGYQTAVISGALPFLSTEFSMTSGVEGFVVSIVLLGAVLGVLFSGTVADRFGRKKAILLPAILFTLGTLIVCTATSIFPFLLGRFITGTAVGLISMTAPLYLAEIAPARLRGTFVCVHQLVVTIGILSAYLVNYVYAAEGAWRDMFMVALVPSIAQCILMLLVCESPSWLLSHGLKDKAKNAFEKLRKDTLWQSHLVPPHVPDAEKKTLASLFFKPKIRYVLILGLILNMFQQITGINTIIYYAPKIFQQAGFQTVNIAILASVGIGLMNVLFTLISMWLIDKAGRRKLLLWGLAGMLLSMQFLAMFLFIKTSYTSSISVISLMCYVGCFAVGIGPVTAVLISELYPLKIRGRAMSIATTANWFFNYLMSLIFLDLMELMGAAGVFELYAALTLAAILFVYFYIPETKGKSLEEIEAGLQ